MVIFAKSSRSCYRQVPQPARMPAQRGVPLAAGSTRENLIAIDNTRTVPVLAAKLEPHHISV